MHTRHFDILFMVLLIIGGLNWGLVGFFNIDLVSTVFGAGTWLSRIIYAVVGIAAVYVLYRKAPQYCHTHQHPKPC